MLHTHLQLYVALTRRTNERSLETFQKSMLFFNSGSTGCGSAFTYSLNGQVSIKTQISDTVAFLERLPLADRALIEGKATTTDCYVRTSQRPVPYTRTFVMPLPSLLR